MNYTPLSVLSARALKRRLRKPQTYIDGHINNQSSVEFAAPRPLALFILCRIIPLSNGQNIKAAMVGRDGVLGACAGFGARHSTSRAVVHIPGQCLWCEVDTLASAIAEFPALRSIVFAHEQALLHHAQQSAACHAVHDLQSRLARHLLRAAYLHGRDDFPLTQEHLAEMLGARRTTVTLLARGLQAAGMIEYRRGRMKICDAIKLENVACECYLAIKENYRALLPKELAPTHTHVVDVALAK
jgi:CRP-like cAMP-binding protein